MDWIGARILRLLHLCDGSVAGIPADIFPIGESYRRHRRFACDIRRRLCCTAYRRVLSRALGRHPWPENRADPLHVPDGHLHDAGRPPAHISAGRHAGAGASCHLAPRPGLRRRRRNIRGQFNDPGACSIWPARILCELYAARRTGRTDSCGGSFPATGSLHAYRGVQ